MRVFGVCSNIADESLKMTTHFKTVKKVYYDPGNKRGQATLPYLEPAENSGDPIATEFSESGRVA